ncbi:DUF21 domain-containing protein [Candidatus Saccharibacteria bacterium]|nr:DUF21 domain-containing protein [Calditrichia bacterium]NIV72015.1 DUF21 domain-containing protein [Calditrichia bacterium]NIV98848.1 DUF21 domain-containing protein [Candidatus Saccharibacteria bacterium]
MFLLLFYLFLALGVSFLCSIMEAVLLSITPSYAAAKEKTSPRIGAKLRYLKSNVDRPLSAILSLNTIAHTVGAAGVGAQAMVVFGSSYVAITSAVLTFLILVLSEIIPKTLGARYWRQLSALTTYTLDILIGLLYPLVWLSQIITKLLSKENNEYSISREEIRAMADVGFEEGLFLEKESKVIKNLTRLRSLKAEDIMTPRPVVFMLSADMTIREVFQDGSELKFSRIPIFENHTDNVQRYVLRNDILLHMARNELDKKLSQLSRKILVVPETVTLIQLFEQLLDRRDHIALAVDEYGGVAGIVTLEDVVETLLGIEIVDETDTSEDMQLLAREQWYKRAKSLGLVSDQDEFEFLKKRKSE